MGLSEALPLLAAAAVGVFAGFINVIAGGGSLLTLPLLNFIGLDMSVANATNRLSLILQNLSATLLYYRQGRIDWREIRRYAVPAVAGALCGTLLAVYMDPGIFRIVAAISISVMGVLLIVKPKMWDGTQGTAFSPFVRIVALFVVGMYGGFLQAGVGFLFIWILAGGCRKDIREANVIKVIIVAIYTFFCLILFASFGLVRWPFALALAVGTTTGGNIGARFNLRGDIKWIRYLLTIAVFASAAKIIFDTIK